MLNSGMTNFPPLRLQVLSGLMELKDRVLADPTFLDSPDIPYDGETLATLKKILAPQVVTKIVKSEGAAPKGERGRPSKEVKLSAEDQEKVRRELDKLLDNLNSMNEGEGMETSERIQITRLKANLIEQLVKLQERAFNVKKSSQFMEITIGILDDLVSEKDRETFLRRIEPYR